MMFLLSPLPASLIFTFFTSTISALDIRPPTIRSNVPTCLQPRAIIGPTAVSTAASLSSAASEACSSIQLISTSLATGVSTRNNSYTFDSFKFKINESTFTTLTLTDKSNCTSNFQSIINTCILTNQSSGSGFWGGWLVQGNRNWTISHTDASFNGSQTSSQSATGPSPSKITAKLSSLVSSGSSVGPATVSTSSYTVQTEASSQNSSSAAAAATSTPAALRSESSNGGTTNSTSTLSPTPSTGTPVSSSSLVITNSSDGTALGTTSLASTTSTAGPSDILMGASYSLTTSQTSTSSFLPIAAYSLPPGGTSIAPNSPAATDGATVMGNILLAVAAALAAAPLAEAAADAAAAVEVEAAIAKIEPFLADLGVDPTKSPCKNGGTDSNPFSGLDKLTDISDIAGCADQVLKALQGALTQAVPDAALAALLLQDLNPLANNAQSIKEDPNEPKTGRVSQLSMTPMTPMTTISSTLSSTSSTTSTSSGCTGCCTWETAATDGGIAAITPAPTDWNDIDRSLKRAIPDRFEQMGPIRKRASTGKPIPIIRGTASSCVLGTPAGIPVTTPAYPGGGVFETLDRNGNLGSLSTVSRYYQMTQTGMPACTPALAQVSVAAWSKSSGPANNGDISIDHAYENGFLQSFMQSIVDSGLPCAVLNSQFFTTSGCPQNRLEPIFGSLASYLNPDFIAMSQYLNGDAKGWILGPSFDPNPGRAFDATNAVSRTDSWKQAMSKISRKNGLATNLVMAGLVINAPDTIARMQRTNNRIYKAFTDFDTWLTTTGASRGIPQTNFGWAAKYKSYMDSYIQQRNGQIASLVSRLVPNVQSDLNTAKSIRGNNPTFLSQEQNLANAIQNTYLSSNAGIDFSIAWEWNVNSVKRDELRYEKRDACSLSSASQSSSSVAAFQTLSSTDLGATLTSSTSTSSGLLVGPTTFCQGLSPGGGDSCISIASGCYASSPLYNVVPQTTCTGSLLSASVAQSTSTAATTPSSSSVSTPTASPTPDYNPSGASSCAGGSSLCRSNPEMGSMCQSAWARWNDTQIYNAYSSLTYINDANEAFTDDGCSAMFDCGSNTYPAMSGADLKAAFGLIGCSVCGNHQLLSNGCVVRLDACNNCQDYVNGVDITPQPNPIAFCDHMHC